MFVSQRRHVVHLDGEVRHGVVPGHRPAAIIVVESSNAVVLHMHTQYAHGYLSDGKKEARCSGFRPGYLSDSPLVESSSTVQPRADVIVARPMSLTACREQFCLYPQLALDRDAQRHAEIARA